MDLWSFSHRSFSDVRYWCQARRSWSILLSSAMALIRPVASASHDCRHDLFVYDMRYLSETAKYRVTLAYVWGEMELLNSQAMLLEQVQAHCYLSLLWLYVMCQLTTLSWALSHFSKWLLLRQSFPKNNNPKITKKKKKVCSSSEWAMLILIKWFNAQNETLRDDFLIYLAHPIKHLLTC